MSKDEYTTTYGDDGGGLKEDISEWILNTMLGECIALVLEDTSLMFQFRTFVFQHEELSGLFWHWFKKEINWPIDIQKDPLGFWDKKFTVHVSPEYQGKYLAEWFNEKIKPIIEENNE